MSTKETINFSTTLVCFYDLLNQRQLLAGLREIPSNQDQQSRFIDAARLTVGTIAPFRDGVLRMIKGFSGVKQRHPAQMQAKDIVRLQQLSRVEVQSQFFADTSLLFTRVDDDAAVSMKAVWGVLCAVGFWHVMLLASNVAGRGAVELGVSADIFPGEVYGPVLADTYRLESCVAEWPRVVIGEQFAAAVEKWATTAGNEVDATIVRGMGLNIRGLLGIDVDGQLILDVLSPMFVEEVGQGDASFKEAIKNAHRFVRSEHTRFEKLCDKKLAGRYANLLAYFENRRSNLR